MKADPMSKFIRSLQMASVFSVFLFVVSLPSLAQTVVTTSCDSEKDSTNWFMALWGGDGAESTVSNLGNATQRYIFASVMGSSQTDNMKCEDTIRSHYGLPEREGGNCSGGPEPICQAFLNQESASASGRSPLAGGLIALGYSAEHILRKNAPPANLAVFWNDAVSKIPIANRALAVDYPALDMFGADVLLNFWKAVRNVALGLLSIVLLVVGIMIILRKKVNPQTVVSIQYSLPRIVLAFVLIILSYPIGATLLNLGWVLSNNASNILSVLIPDPQFSMANVNGPVALGAIVSLILTAGIVIGAAAAAAPVVVVIAVALVLLYVYYWIKMFLVYLKMLFSILSAPLEFALSAIPGSQDKVMAWFKRMGIYTLTLFLMGAVPGLSFRLALALVAAGTQTTGGFGWGLLIAFAAPLIVMLYGFGLAIGMESRVQKIIDPESAKRR